MLKQTPSSSQSARVSNVTHTQRSLFVQCDDDDDDVLIRNLYTTGAQQSAQIDNTRVSVHEIPQIMRACCAMDARGIGVKVVDI